MAFRYTIKYHNYPLRRGYSVISRVLATLFHNFYLIALQFILVWCLVVNALSIDSTLLLLVIPTVAAVLYVVLVWKIEIIVVEMMDKKYEAYVRELASKDPETYAKRLQQIQERQTRK